MTKEAIAAAQTEQPTGLETVLRASQADRWIVYGLGCVVLALMAVALLRPGSMFYSAFGAYRASGWAAAHGLNPYAAYPETFRSSQTASGAPQVVVDVNLNPPCFLPVLQMLSRLTVTEFGIVWTVSSLLLLASGVAMLLGHRRGMQKRQVLWLLLSTPVMNTLWGAQIYFLLFFLSAVGWTYFDTRRELAAAVAIGAMVAIKPTLLLWPVLLLVAHHRRLALTSLATALAISAAPLPFYGVEVYRQWLAAAAHDNHWLIATDIAIPAYFARLGMHNLGLALAAAIAAIFAGWIWVKRPDVERTSGVAICVSILCAPLAWVAYTLFVAPWFVARRWNALSTVAALLLALPSSFTPPILYFAGISIILVGFLRTPQPQHNGGGRC